VAIEALSEALGSIRLPWQTWPLTELSGDAWRCWRDSKA